MSFLVGLAGIASIGAAVVVLFLVVEACFLSLSGWLLGLPAAGFGRALGIGVLALLGGILSHGMLAPFLGSRLTGLLLYGYWILLVEEIYDTSLDRAWVCCTVVWALEWGVILVAMLLAGGITMGPELAPYLGWLKV